MLSLIISIASLVALIAGVSYLAYIYLPKIVEMFNGAYDLIIALSASLPDWLLPIVGISLLVAGVSLAVKLL